MVVGPRRTLAVTDICANLRAQGCARSLQRVAPSKVMALSISQSCIVLLRAWSIALMALLLAPSVASAAQDSPLADKTLSPYFIVEGADPKVEGFPLESTKVDV